MSQGKGIMQIQSIKVAGTMCKFVCAVIAHFVGGTGDADAAGAGPAVHTVCPIQWTFITASFLSVCLVGQKENILIWKTRRS